ncbi:hypothetical protein V5799_000851 [Amblyomma americanum]|uniref:Juvenile hormone acid methyltransferase n=1 Tax=Amblyomma americanum TaxID=6943 RepID=A0AAQ4D1V7_AMBAM
MLKFARENRSDPKIEYQGLDVLADEAVARFVRAEGRFQRVYSFLVLHWIADHRHALRNIEALTAPAGECFLVFSNNLAVFDVFTAMMRSARWSKYSDVYATRNAPILMRSWCTALLTHLHCLNGLFSVGQVLLRVLPETRDMEDVISLRSHLVSVVRATSLLPLACEVFRLTGDMGLSKERALDFFCLVNPVYPSLDDGERAELRSFTDDVMRDFTRRRSGRAIGEHQLLVIHACKPRE